MILPQNKNLYPTCRICRSDEPNSFIAPCKCKGTVKYVHRTCLMQWRKRLVSNGSNRRELDTCTLCNFRYIVKQNSKFGNVMTRLDELLDLFHQQQLQQQQHQQQQQQFLHDNFENLNKKFILWGCCAVVTSLWFHYSLSSLKVTTNQEEFPLLILRWVTISMAVLDFGLRRIFWQLSKINFDDGEVLSIQKIDFNEL
ncbi:hypothetical protein RhiirA5_451715 [Rhizophagus irregularis]|uniref:RING-CH-type domain-containing protein n=1 Tax=Rhizophagus irregularis TaxID=588596 RepID=A0A2N0Q6N7_9GLOM|nr:hypothetical protein RhiirA5_451715 [Rhizophagus irregularis]PKC61414.1 hypothetical protein RhiirA1_398432 [Rhizophagus irregularis]